MSARSTATKSERAWNFQEGPPPYADSLFNTALKLTRNREDAEDLLQETYLKAYAHYDGFSEGTNLRAWLFRILKNGFINRYRHSRIAPREVGLTSSDDAISALDKVAFDLETPETRLISTSLDSEVADAISSLPREFREVVELCDLEGHSYREIAARLQVPIGTVMSRLYRGRRLLESALLSYGRRRNYLADETPLRRRSVVKSGAPGSPAPEAAPAQKPADLSEYRQRRRR